MPKIVNTEEIRIEIIRKAFEVFIDKGYYKSNMVDISGACNMNRTTIYYYFKNKDEIFENTVYFIIGTIEKDIEEISQNNEINVVDKIKYLSNKWDEEFDGNNIILILIEMWLSIRREESEMFKRIKTRVKEMNRAINTLILKKVKFKNHSKKERLEIAKCYIIISLLHQISSGTELVSENIMSIISLL